ncbi:MAG: beta-N-acetylhexosaminidase [Gammaproteobacteria bacterium]
MQLGPIMIDLQTTSLTPEECDLLQHPALGGIILFTRNYESPRQLKKLLHDIRALRDPLLIAVDQEGGRVQRFRQGFSLLPPLSKLGDGYLANPEQAITLSEDHAYIMARELLQVDVDFSFTPVLDVGSRNQTVIGDRSFSSQPAIVCELGSAYIRGLHKAGMVATGKHFPGHGAVLTDSHYELPIDERDWLTISQNDLLPFARLATDLAAVMTVHVRYPKIDNAPVSFSHHWLQQVLRQQLGFQGVIFSDDLSMAGAAWAGNMLQRTQAALAAGCDMVLVCNQRSAVYEILDSLDIAANPSAQPRLLAMRGTILKER